MKMIFYINSISNGGAERVIVNLANTFALHNYSCILVTSFVSEKEYAYNNLIKRISLEEKIEQNWIKRNISRTAKLRKICKQEKPDVLVSFMAEPNFRAIIASAGLKTKNLISIRNDPNKEYPNMFFRILAKNLYRFADGIVFQTEDAKKWFPMAIQKKSKIIFNQVAENFYDVKYEGKRHDIVATGRLASQKNHKMLIRAFAKVSDKTKENLYIYGEGKLRQELQSLIDELGMQDRIFLPGAISDVAQTIKEAKIYVLSSDYEGMPNALMEAMALGLPCISTDCPCGGPKMLIEDGKNGLLIPIGDIEKLAQALLRLLEDEVYSLQLGEKARESAMLYKPEKIFEEWKSYIEQL